MNIVPPWLRPSMPRTRNPFAFGQRWSWCVIGAPFMADGEYQMPLHFRTWHIGFWFTAARLAWRSARIEFRLWRGTFGIGGRSKEY